MLKRFLQRIPTPLFFLFIVILAYGIYIPWFGFYGDDWSYIWYQHLLGFGGAGDFASYDRPFSALYYNVVIFLLGEQVWPYQVFAILLRWLSAVLVWQVLKQVWKKHSTQIFWISILFALYPGFGQQPVAVEFILHFAVLDMFLLSLVGMIQSVDRSQKTYIFLTILSMFCAASLFGLEYFIGLEILRPIFLWIILSSIYSDRKERFQKLILYWLPYLAVLGAFLYWRVFVFQFPTYKPGLFKDIITNPASTLPDLLRRVLVDLKEVLVDAWQLVARYPGGRLLWQYISLVSGSVMACLLFYYFYLNRTSKTVIETTHKNWWQDWHLELIVVGFISMLAAGVPFWVTGIPLEISFPWDRTTLPFMLGACMVVASLIDLIIHPRFVPAAFAVMVGLTLGSHMVNADIYHQEWEHMKSFYWQLTWRAPALKPGTIITSDQIPLYKVSDSGMTAPLNWTYAPNYQSRNLIYKVFDLDLRLDSEYAGIPEVKKGLPIEHNYRSLFFKSNTSSLLVFYDKRNTCLHVLAPDDGTIAGLPEKIDRVVPLSNLNQITDTDTPAHPPLQVFGNEPEHGWCYYFQKADLARQKKDWNQIINIWKQTEEQGLHPLDPVEWMPFIEGLAFTHDLEKSSTLSLEVNQVAGLRNRLCLSWQRIYAETTMNPLRDKIIPIMNEINCQPK